ncbi:MAG: ribosome silencing factor [Turneriella sp.]|nr:ribosome silencing factor [Turneriella sp.]
MSSRELADITTIARALEAKKAADVVVLDLRRQSSYLSYFIIATALSKAHLKTLYEEIEKVAREHKIERPRPQSPQFDSGWVTYDFGFYVVHLFEEEKRRFYDLESVWKNATRLNLPDGASLTDLTSRKGTSKSSVTTKKQTGKSRKTSAGSASLAKKKTTRMKTTKEKTMATAKKKPAKKAAKKPAKKKAAKKV